MPIFRLDDSLRFPPASKATRMGLLAIGGDLRPERILKAYAQGIFPWYEAGEPILWWSPDPRMVMLPQEVYISKSMRRVLRDQVFQLRFDTAFEQVVMMCASPSRRDFSGTWITPELAESFVKLHEMGLAHSVEAWQHEQLVGGLYGLSLGACFFGESMFHTVSNASKAALITLAQFLHKQGFMMIDAQQETEHLSSLGARPWPRADFLAMLTKAVNMPTLKGKWDSPQQFFVHLSL
ncbi:MAG TPA: leucyl/phenylalanyl-tRNA--protein transferase [Bacteroidales bacterium]|nr:leucyl/phenylalanyl-tRNA--protein transferase [Bacteroidales bacterium]